MKRMSFGIMLFTGGIVGVYTLTVPHLFDTYISFENYLSSKGLFWLFIIYLLLITVGIGICFADAYDIDFKKWWERINEKNN